MLWLCLPYVHYQILEMCPRCQSRGGIFLKETKHQAAVSAIHPPLDHLGQRRSPATTYTNQLCSQMDSFQTHVKNFCRVKETGATQEDWCLTWCLGAPTWGTLPPYILRSSLAHPLGQSLEALSIHRLGLDGTPIRLVFVIQKERGRYAHSDG